MNWTDEDIARHNARLIGTTTPIHIEGLPFKMHPTDNLKPEWMIEAECTKLLEEDGWRALRTDPVSDRGRGKGFGEIGMADHQYIRYCFDANSELGKLLELPKWRTSAQIMWIEFKSAKGKPTSKQLEWHRDERARGALTLIAGQDFPASVEGFRAWYKSSGLQRNG